MSQTASTASTSRHNSRSWLARFRRTPVFYPLIGFIVVFVAMAVINDNFLTSSNLFNLARQASIIAILAAGMSLAILTGGIDLSVGPVMALSGTVMAGLMVAGMPPSVAIIAGLLVGAAFGTINGMFVAFAGMPPIIVTLATMGIARGLALIYTGGYPISGLPPEFAFFGRGTLGGIEMPIIIMIAVFAIGYVLLSHTATGRYLYAIGGNEEATRLSGIRVSRYKMLVYMLSGTTAAIAGLILTSRLMSGQPNAGIGFELDAIAAVVLGGAAITGGRGMILGTLVGAMLLGVLNNGLNLMGVSPYLQNVIKGCIILLAIYISRKRAL
ncbi:ABC transporter permease [Halomonas huangheensis]|uniref:Sugar ABC transporter permease n=1 Tax=Halomonas huangheensis TaxID=1178482 RepID=W1NAD7_9GAMM|nr:sugar ABC transporter permease [Halomonas huangheensis]ALM53883.1 ribose ABC transporter permease [Halomonas huangheensis]ERL52171.1 sugar ABC transporter permease [Halomonas huangheensis]